jgi:hypothetical protein
MQENNRPLALQPRQNNFAYLLGFDGVAGTLDDMVFSPNEDYDAPDVQNMLLGYMPILPASPPLIPGINTIIPSLHRPQMIEFWRNQATWATAVNLPRQVILRPIGNFTVNTAAMPPAAVDHPNFTGSNPAFDAVLGPWDVDNDGDGIADSIWVDLGLPVQTAADGRRFKPLAAILCLDLDGRLNVNAHGSIDKFTAVPTNGPFAGSPANSSPALPSGEGYGPADIDLSVLFPTPAAYMALLRGGGGITLVGRYGEPAGSALPGMDAIDEPLSFVKQFEFPRTNPATRTSFSSPPDLWARELLGLDYRGLPMRYGVRPVYVNDDSTDDPYEMNLSRRVVRSVYLNTGADYPFTATELERSLRKFDVDAQALPNRLQSFLNTALPVASRAVTTDAYDLPVPSFRPTRDMLLGADGIADGGGSNDGIAASLGISPTNLGIVDLLKYRLIQGGVGVGAVNAMANQMLSPELIAGLKIDINRPFGNGRDDDAAASPGYNIVDDPDEATLGPGEIMWTDGNYPAGFNLVPFRHNNWEINIDGLGGVTAADSLLDRQLMARHLFVLAMLLKDSGMQIPIDGKGPTQPAETARAIAQWAINVVDFRDADAIMTPFEYPNNPFTTFGWNVDSDPKTPEAAGGLVWGCERPELLITETFAFHDRRTEDLPADSSLIPSHTVGSGIPPDTTFDQQLVPRDALFVELYNPSSPSAATPAEFYFDPGTGFFSPGLLLDKLTPASAGAQAPVWRLLVVGGANKQNDLHDPIVLDRPTAADIERSIYFTPAAPTIPTGAEKFYTSLNVAPIPPGNFAVLGPNERGSAGPVHHIVVGRNTTDSNAAPYSITPPGTRRIDLDPTNGIVVTYDNAGGAEPTAGDTKPAVAIVIDSPRGISVSDPSGGYPATNSTAGLEPSYGPAIDTPFDDGVLELKTTGTYPGFKTLHLQRLANPLKPWNPEFGEPGHDPALADVNPYITIDTMPIDLTSFNGVADSDPKDVNAGTEGNVMFASRSRGEQNDPPAVITDPSNANLWRQEPFGKPPVASPPGGPATNYFPVLLQHTLGFMNTALGARFTAGNLPSGNAAYLGDPQNRPFPWLTWNNRPFVGPGELLLVPRTRPSQINAAYTQVAAAGADPYTNIGAPYGHLFNFFHTAALPGTASQMHRILDYVQVPSRFVGTETVLNPGVAYFGNLGFGVSPPGFHPPFNKVSNYRDPGRVNINTIPGDGGTIWQGILNGRALPLWASIDDSRRGPAGSPDAFANPFRSAGGVTAVPPSAFAALLRDTDVTFLRGATNSPWTAAASLFADVNPALHNESNRNPYFHYQSLMRLSNLLTTRSNVYAVWVTVGYFEVSPVAVDAAHPDGFTLGQEIGSETGEIKRPRAFYIYDRSIPVGFEPGKDHNIEQGTLIKRFIE